MFVGRRMHDQGVTPGPLFGEKGARGRIGAGRGHPVGSLYGRGQREPGPCVPGVASDDGERVERRSRGRGCDDLHDMWHADGHHFGHVDVRRQPGREGGGHQRRHLAIEARAQALQEALIVA